MMGYNSPSFNFWHFFLTSRRPSAKFFSFPLCVRAEIFRLFRSSWNFTTPLSPSEAFCQKKCGPERNAENKAINPARLCCALSNSSEVQGTSFDAKVGTSVDIASVIFLKREWLEASRKPQATRRLWKAGSEYLHVRILKGTKPHSSVKDPAWLVKQSIFAFSLNLLTVPSLISMTVSF